MLQGETFGSVSVIVDGDTGVLVLDPSWNEGATDEAELEASWNAAVGWAFRNDLGFQDGEGDYPHLRSEAGTEFYYLVGTPA